MKVLFTTLTVLLSVVLFSQNTKQRIEELPVFIHNGCDTVNHQPIEGLELGELPLTIEVKSAKMKSNGVIRIRGLIKTMNSDELVPEASVYLSIFNENHCELLKKLETTSEKGEFDVSFENHKNLSLFISALSYQGLEIKIGELVEE